MDNAKDMVRDLLEVQSKALIAGRDLALAAERVRYSPLLRTLRREFQNALLDPDSRIKSSLQVAILAILAMYEGDEANDYANAMVKRDRTASRDDHDQTTRGGSLKDAA
jgi:hypothetical protein